ncbi:MAG: universal stress protein [Deltaproteobacteria bacterium]|nr:universal stress protein [Deltaproteobacteria bacterium]
MSKKIFWKNRVSLSKPGPSPGAQQEIVRIADKEDYALIVVGAQGQSLMEK